MTGGLNIGANCAVEDRDSRPPQKHEMGRRPTLQDIAKASRAKVATGFTPKRCVKTKG
jgi:hypothetical protein